MQCLIPSSKLDQFRCSECCHPLSIGPIRVKPDGKSICGRCNYKIEPGFMPLPQNYAYEAAASVYLFPCIYQQSGCPTHISFNDTTLHEAFCSFRSCSCPVQSGCLWSGKVQELPDHYLTAHRELCVENPPLELPLQNNFAQPYLLYYRNRYFLLPVKNSVEEAKLCFNLINLGNPEEIDTVQYSLQLANSQTNSCVTLEERVALPPTYLPTSLNDSLDVDRNGILAVLKHPEALQCSWNIKIDKEFEKRKLKLEMLKCLECENYMCPPIYECPNNHFCCADCKGFEVICMWCIEDGCGATSMFQSQDLEKFAKDISFPCKWKGCHLKAKDIGQHQQECIMRKYNCPFKLCEEWSGSLADLKEHLKTYHAKNQFHIASDASFSTYRSGSFFYILAHGEIFLCDFKQTEKKGLLLICYNGDPSVSNNFEYELEVINSSGVSELYKLSRIIGNQYKTEVPPRIIKDSDCKYKINIIKCAKLCLDLSLE